MSQDGHDPELDALIAEGRADDQPEHILFCNNECSLRDTCGLRLGSKALVDAHGALSKEYDEGTMEDEQLQAVEPVIEFFQERRSHCAAQRQDVARQQTTLKDELRPVIQELLAELLPKVAPKPKAIPVEANGNHGLVEAYLAKSDGDKRKAVHDLLADGAMTVPEVAAAMDLTKGQVLAWKKLQATEG